MLAVLGLFELQLEATKQEKNPQIFISFLVFKCLSGEEESMKQYLGDANFTVGIRNTFKHKLQLPYLLEQR